MVKHNLPPQTPAKRSIPPEKEFTVVLTRPLLQTDRRREKRYRCGPATLVPMQLTGTTVRMDAWACNLSEGGIGLNLPYPLELGTAVVLRLRGRRTTTMAARVVHATEQDDGMWRIGCAFDRPLDRDTLEGLL
jgi:hypothetical protein